MDKCRRVRPLYEIWVTGGNRFSAREPPGPARIEKTFSELSKAGFVLFEQTPAPRRANLRFGTAPALNRRIPSNRGRHEKSRKRRCSQRGDQGRGRGRQCRAGDKRCLLPASPTPGTSTRTFLTDTLEGFGFATRECARLAALGAALDARAPDLVVIGSSAGGIEACEMMEMLAAKDYDGKVLVLGPRTSPMVAAVRALGKTLGLAMLPLLATPFSAGTLGDAVASLLHAKAAPAPAAGSAEALGPRAPELWYQPKLDARTLALSGAAARDAAGDPSERIEHDGGPRSAARSERVMARAGGGLALLSCPERRRRDRGRAPDRVLSRSGVGRNAVPAVARSPGLRRASSSRSTPRRPFASWGW